MHPYKITAPFEDFNLPMYAKWAICANDLQIINEIENYAEAKNCLELVLDIDQEGTLLLILKKSGLSLNQTPFSYVSFKAAVDHFKTGLDK